MKYHWMRRMNEIISSVNLYVERIINCWIFFVPIVESHGKSTLIREIPEHVYKWTNEQCADGQSTRWPKYGHTIDLDERETWFAVCYCVDSNGRWRSSPFMASILRVLNVVRQLLFRTKRAIKIVISWSVNHDFRMNIYRQNNYCGEQ